MALDGLFLHIVAEELQELVGQHVYKIHQPAREEVIFAFKNGKKLLFSVNANTARIHITNQNIENPKQPPMFCMLLRKYFGNSKLLSITQDGLERILTFTFEHTNEIGDKVLNSVVAEIMGKHSNLILVSGGKIIDCLKRSEDAFSGERVLLPTAAYIPPKRPEKINFYDIPEIGNYCFCCCENSPVQVENYKEIVEKFEGISPDFARYLVAQSEDIVKDLLEKTNNYYLLSDCVLTVLSDIYNKKYKFAIFYENNEPKKFTVMSSELCDMPQVLDVKYLHSANETLDVFFHQKSSNDRLKQRADYIFNLLNSTTRRISKRINEQKIDLENCKEKEYYKLCGDLIYANVYQIKPETAEVILENFYNKNEPITVYLDPNLTPPQNAQKYYKQYKKLQNAEKKLNEQLLKGFQELDYIESVAECLNRVSTEEEIISLRQELEQTGYIRKNSGGKQKEIALKPLEFNVENFKILVGRNNIQNDKLTFKIANKTDIWLHTQKIHGSHVIIKGENPSREILEFAAKLAVKHSKAKNSNNVPVDYTFVKYVKKPNGSKPGFVIYTNQNTIFVNGETYDRDAEIV
jgi:predicted ribosome quality control (RQC) complex YloA/Tae2 family protein